MATIDITRVIITIREIRRVFYRGVGDSNNYGSSVRGGVKEREREETLRRLIIMINTRQRGVYVYNIYII